MKIGIDISQLAYPGTGVATYTENLVRSLLEIDKEDEFCLFFSSFRRKLLVSNFEFLNKPKTSNFKIKNFRFPPLILETLWNQFHTLSIEKLVGKIDVFHTSDWLEPPSNCPKVTTIHDLAVYKYPETLPGKIVNNQRRKLEWVKKESNIIIAVSESTKEDVMEILKIPEKKIRVVYEAVEPTINNQQSTIDREQIKKKYGIADDYLLVVGTREPRKNLKMVIEASQLLSDRNLQLVIAGKYGWGEDIANSRLLASIRRSGPARQVKYKMEKIKLLGYVPKEDLAVLYAGAQVFVYPSLYEGFGLPILEAMSCGCPVVTSKTSSMPEVAGNAAILVDPLKVEEIAKGIEKALKEREELIKKGLERAKLFSWEKTAKETLVIYKEVVTC